MTLLRFFWNQPVTVPPPGGGMDTGGGMVSKWQGNGINKCAWEPLSAFVLEEAKANNLFRIYWNEDGMPDLLAQAVKMAKHNKSSWWQNTLE